LTYSAPTCSSDSTKANNLFNTLKTYQLAETSYVNNINTNIGDGNNPIYPKATYAAAK
jgi:hypothetical protein